MMKISFSPPDIGEQEIVEVAEALRSGAAYERVGATDSCVLPYGPGRVPELRYGMYGTDFAGFGRRAW